MHGSGFPLSRDGRRIQKVRRHGLRIHDMRHLHISLLTDIGSWAAEIIECVGRKNINIVF